MVERRVDGPADLDRVLSGVPADTDSSARECESVGATRGWATVYDPNAPSVGAHNRAVP